MTDRGTLGGTSSNANGVNADGSVVVGYAYTIGNAGQRAFRWTDGAGMVSVEDWLRANGVTIAADFTSDANSVSADGNVVVGVTSSNTGFIARISSVGSGIIDVNEFLFISCQQAVGQCGSQLCRHHFKWRPW